MCSSRYSPALQLLISRLHCLIYPLSLTLSPEEQELFKEVKYGKRERDIERLRERHDREERWGKEGKRGGKGEKKAAYSRSYQVERSPKQLHDQLP